MGILFVKRHGTRYIIFLKAPSITTNNISNMDTSNPFMVTPTHAKHMHIGIKNIAP
jgi:hypothetical protein